MKPLTLILIMLLSASIFSGCTTVSTLADDSASQAGGKYQDSLQQSTLATMNIESSDLHDACAGLVGKMLAHPKIAGQCPAPHVVVDPAFFKSEANLADDLNVNMVVDLVRSELLSAAEGRVVLVGREYLPFLSEERKLQQYDALKKAEVLPVELEEKGPVGPGVTQQTKKTLGADYLIGGRITDTTVEDAKQEERYTQIAFEVVDAKTAEIVLCELYYFKKNMPVQRTKWHF